MEMDRLRAGECGGGDVACARSGGGGDGCGCAHYSSSSHLEKEKEDLTLLLLGRLPFCKKRKFAKSGCPSRSNK